MASLKNWTTTASLALISLVFFLSALPFADRLGLEADEALVGNGIYARGAPIYSLKHGGIQIPIMLLSYLGALKTWFYKILFHILAPSPMSIRIPNIMLGVTTVWLCFLVFDRVAGRRAAWIGAWLLATDTSFVLLETTDFGFIALQFVFKLGALLLLLRFHDQRRARFLAGGFFLLGLAMWDKAVFSWVLFGLVAGAVLVLPREFRQHLTRRNVITAGVAMMVGALPLVIYNFAVPLVTLRTNAKFSTQDLSAKETVLLRTMDGSLLFGFMTAVETGPKPGTPANWFQRFAFNASEATPRVARNLTVFASAISILSLPFLWRSRARKAMLFGIVVCAATYLPMAFTLGAGGAAHHVILLWPFHFLIVAAVLSRAPVPLAVPLTILLVGANVALTNEYHVDAVRNGGAIVFTDAIYPLNDCLARVDAKTIYSTDWGYAETINMLSKGLTPISAIDISLPQTFKGAFSDPTAVFVSHTRHYAIMADLRTALDEAAERAGYHEQLVQTIYDGNQRAIFEIFRFQK